MTDLEKIAYTKTFIDKLANGINPLDDTPIPEGDIANNVRLSRCFFYVSDILRQVIENGGVERPAKKAKERKQAFALTEEQRSALEVSEVPTYVSAIAERINSLVDLTTTKKLSAATINNWLVSVRLLEYGVDAYGKNKKLPTEQGREIGIYSEERVGTYGSYTAILFNSAAQQFIYDNLDAIIDFKYNKKDPLEDFHNREWTEAHDKKLSEMLGRGSSVAEIAAELRRTEESVRARIAEIGE
ncbi:MAG: hypothetical protein IJ011_07005 [Clostridia bacterium]|nr:hypothetical protein [Clostridia bacterium]